MSEHREAAATPTAAAQYDWPNARPGILGHHAGRCPARSGAPCTCGPLGWRSSLEDPATGTTMLSPVLDSESDALRWRREQQAGLAAADSIAPDSTRMSTVVEAFLDAAEDGGVRCPDGRPYGPAALRELRWTLQGHVVQELGSMSFQGVRRMHLQTLVAELHEAGLSTARVAAVLDALRALYDFARDRGFTDANPVESLALPAHPEELRRRLGTTVDLDAIAGPGDARPSSIPLETALSWGIRLSVMVFVLIALVLVAESV
jgi:hypothetical protein